MCVTWMVHTLLIKQSQTVQICHQKILNLDKTLILKEKDQLKYQYQIIAHESYQRNTRLSAAGFFSVDNSLIFLIFTTVCNNVLAMYQIFS